MTAVATTPLDYIRELVLKESAIVLDPSKGYLVETRLSPVARQHGMRSLDELVETLTRRPNPELRRQVVEALTTNETSFFRDLHPFEMLRAAVLPELLNRRVTQRTLTIWSAACSTGQEPDTISILLREHFPQLSNWRVKIMASDLSQQVLERAKEGVFSQNDVNRGLPAPQLVKYFTREGTSWRIKDEIRRTVEFFPMNLIGTWPPLPTVDVIFLRNVLIYFDTPTKQMILDRARRQLPADGYLFLGGAETTLNLHDGFQRLQHERGVCYRPR